MQYILKNIAIPISEKPDFGYLVKKKFGLNLSEVDSHAVVKRAIDARKKNRLQFVYTLSLSTSRKLKAHADIFHVPESDADLTPRVKLENPNPFIIGMGPAGLFAALKLVESGFKPYLFEQGASIEKREEKVNLFWKDKTLDSQTNVQFGEGGAGAFSDGKLTARTKNTHTEQVFEYLIRFGADPDISIDALPHIGTDELLLLIKDMREYLIEKGCKFFYNHKLEDIEVQNERIISVKINNQTYSPEIVILATGNSARDVFSLLNKRSIPIESKPFAVGLRIEHPIDFINHTFYGDKNDFDITGAATYKLVSKYNSRSIYSFCMCPGGYVIPAHSEIDGQVVNGMSYSKRDNAFSNSALVVNVNSDDFGSKALDGVDFQVGLERQMFDGFVAPVQDVSDFMKTKEGTMKNNSYFFETKSVNFHDKLPSFICESIYHSLIEFDKRYRGFVSNGLFLGVETRTSSPVRIIRDHEKLCSPDVSNLYPIGEGSGYAGGIISSAGDGMRIGGMFYSNSG